VDDDLAEVKSFIDGRQGVGHLLGDSCHTVHTNLAYVTHTTR
jgi:hypothetical protein